MNTKNYRALQVRHLKQFLLIEKLRLQLPFFVTKDNRFFPPEWRYQGPNHTG